MTKKVLHCQHCDWKQALELPGCNLDRSFLVTMHPSMACLRHAQQCMQNMAIKAVGGGCTSPISCDHCTAMTLWRCLGLCLRLDVIGPRKKPPFDHLESKSRCKPSSNCFCFAAMSIYIYIYTYIFTRIDFQEVLGRQRMAPKRNSTVKDLWPWWHRTCGPTRKMCYFSVPLHSSHHWVHEPQHGSPDKDTPWKKKLFKYLQQDFPWNTSSGCFIYM